MRALARWDERIAHPPVLAGGMRAEVMDVRGHTRGHIAFHFPEEGSAFVGDALFAMGCGRCFEGPPSPCLPSSPLSRNLTPVTLVPLLPHRPSRCRTPSTPSLAVLSQYLATPSMTHRPSNSTQHAH